MVSQGFQPPQQGQVPQAQTQDDVPDYLLQVPDSIWAGVEAEDPMMRRKAITALLSGYSRTVHHTLTQQMRQVFQSLPMMMGQMINSQQTQKSIFDDFYGNYRDLNDPELFPLVQSVARGVLQQMGAQGWSPQVRQRVAEAVYAKLGRPAPGAQPGVVPATVFNGSASRPTASAPNSVMQGIMELL